MKVLITNDDGIDSPGLAVLARIALARGFDVVIAAPERESSGASASITGAEEDGRLLVSLRKPPGLDVDVASYGVRAAPGLITFAAAYDGFGAKPDLVLSGINRGQNTGHAVLHSGTVGAPLTGTTHGIPGLAVSLASADPQHWDTPVPYVEAALDWLLGSGLRDRVVNLNVPDVLPAEVRGLRQAPLAAVGVVQGTVHELDEGHLQLTYADVAERGDAGSDAVLLADGFATLTILRAPVFDLDPSLPEHEGPLVA
ncbi:MAG: 5'/3'-nucleotidase SurE [Actinomycetales bacterium]|nr:5'/3'-nucleotidase SurE [Actinomycetales bacterium]